MQSDTTLDDSEVPAGFLWSSPTNGSSPPIASCSVVNDIKPAGQIVRDLAAAAEVALAGATHPA
jgi:hypothetical protein